MPIAIALKNAVPWLVIKSGQTFETALSSAEVWRRLRAFAPLQAPLGEPQRELALFDDTFILTEREIRAVPIALHGKLNPTVDGTQIEIIAREGSLLGMLLTMGLFSLFVSVVIWIQGISVGWLVFIPVVLPVIVLARLTGMLHGQLVLVESLQKALKEST